ncbi:MAG TPA: hypothetical protein VIJ95_07100 [Hanamia sp.]
MKIIFLFSFSFLFFIRISQAQKITYSTEKINSLELGYNILNKINEKYFIYIAYFNPAPSIHKSYIFVYNKQMQLLSKEELKLPDEYYALRFITYPDFIYIFYQYTQNNHVFCMAAKIDSNGKMNEKPVLISEINLNNFYLHSTIYNLTYSEDKKKIAVFTIQENKNEHELNLRILDQSLKKIEHKIFEIPINSEFESFTNFSIDNEGNFFFLKKEPYNDADPYKNVLNLIKNNTDTLTFYYISPNGIKLNDLSFRINNADKKLNFFSFYVDSPLRALWKDIPLSKATGNSGIFNAIWDIKNKSLIETEVPFTKILDPNSNNPELLKLQMQDFFVGDIYFTKNGSFVLQGQTSDPYNPYESFLIPYDNNSIGAFELYYQGINESGYLSFNNFNLNQHRSGTYKVFFRRTQTKINKVSANLLLLSFDSTGTFTKLNFANEFKARDFMTMNTGDALHYFFFRKERNNYLVRHLSFTNKGGIQSEIPLKTNENYKFALGYEQTTEALGYKQVSETEMIFPVFYRGNLNFAKIEF